MNKKQLMSLHSQNKGLEAVNALIKIGEATGNKGLLNQAYGLSPRMHRLNDPKKNSELNAQQKEIFKNQVYNSLLSIIEMYIEDDAPEVVYEQSLRLRFTTTFSDVGKYECIEEIRDYAKENSIGNLYTEALAIIKIYDEHKRKQRLGLLSFREEELSNASLSEKILNLINKYFPDPKYSPEPIDENIIYAFFRNFPEMSDEDGDKAGEILIGFMQYNQKLKMSEPGYDNKGAYRCREIAKWDSFFNQFQEKYKTEEMKNYEMLPYDELHSFVSNNSLRGDVVNEGEKIFKKFTSYEWKSRTNSEFDEDNKQISSLRKEFRKWMDKCEKNKPKGISKQEIVDLVRHSDLKGACLKIKAKTRDTKWDDLAAQAEITSERGQVFVAIEEYLRSI